MRGRDGDAAACHAREEDRGRLLDLHPREPRLVLLGGVALEVRPVVRARNDLLQVRHHLAAVAGAQRERVLAAEEALELLTGASVEEDRLGPSLARAQHVAVAEAAARGEALERG